MRQLTDIQRIDSADITLWLVPFSYCRRKKRISEKVTPGFDIGYIIDLTASSRIKLHPVWN